MGHPQENLPTDLQVRLHKHIQGMTDHTLTGVLDRYDSVVDVPLLHLGEDLADGVNRDAVSRTPKPPSAGQVGKRPLRTEIGQLQRALYGSTGGDDFTKDR